jgi:biopolymer transport protein ExbB/TolQ
MNRLNQLVQATAKSPILWGVLGSTGFFLLVHLGPLGTPFIKRYFTSHPVEYAETVLFAVGLAALALKTLEVAGQYAGLRAPPLGPITRAAEPTEQQCQDLLGQLDRLPQRRHDEYYARRLRAAIEYVRRLGSTQGLDDKLTYLADLDATRAHNGYALFRVIIWAIPILGFLGTVIGITKALNGIDPKALDQSMMEVITGLGLKFDTTALALGLSMVLMFIHFFVDRAENSLLEEVDRHVETDLEGRFQQAPTGPDGQVVAMRRMAEVMVQAADRLVEHQTQLWQVSMDAAAARWTRMAEPAGEQLKQALAEALAESLGTHARQLAATEQASTEQNRRQWATLGQALGENLQGLAAIQEGITRQAEVLSRAIEASGEVTQLQDVLNRNLAALGGAKHFEQTVLGLSATINLLNARLADPSAGGPAIQLELPERRQEMHPTIRRAQAA